MDNKEFIVNNIINGINVNWNKLQKIRYVYLKLGEYLEKNVEFFLNDKLGPFELSNDQIYKIYDDDILPIRKNKAGNDQYQVICKSAAFLLKTIFDKININSEYVYTALPSDSQESSIRHWFIIVQDDEKKQYFLTLAADLPYIKNYFPTEHFASDIKYLSSDGVPNYVISQDTSMSIIHIENGNSEYQEFEHTILSEEDLKQIDYSIGYEKLYQAKQLISSSNFQSLFYEEEEMNSEIYDIFRKTFNISNDGFISGYSIQENDIDMFIDNLNKYVESKIGNDEKIIEILGKQLENPVYNSSNKLSLFVNDNKRKLKKIKDSQKKEMAIMLIQLYELEGRFIELKNAKIQVYEFYNKNKSSNNYSIEEYHTLCDNYKHCIENVSMLNLNPLLNRIVFYFIKDKISTQKSNSYVSIEYILEKFTAMFPLVFDCNYENIKTTKRNSFSIQNYSEQVVIIKMMLEKIFPELTIENCRDIEEYNGKYSPVENRVQIFPLRNRKTGEYCIGFNFGKKKEENSPEYIYIPSQNLLRLRDPIKDRRDYWICSMRFNNSIQNVENMEEKLISESKVR